MDVIFIVGCCNAFGLVALALGGTRHAKQSLRGAVLLLAAERVSVSTLVELAQLLVLLGRELEQTLATADRAAALRVAVLTSAHDAQRHQEEQSQAICIRVHSDS